MNTVFIVLQFLCLFVQVGSLVYAVVTKRAPIDVLYGFSIWGFIPVLIFGFLSNINL